MNYLKKICVFKEIGAGYTYNGKPINGMLKCELVNQTLTLNLSLSTLAPTRVGEYQLVVGRRESFECFEVTGGECVIKTQNSLVDITQPFCAGIFSCAENKLICYASSTDYKAKLTDIVDFYTNHKSIYEKEEKEIEEQIDECFEYSDDAVVTENYYENEDVDIKNLSLKEGFYDCETNQNANAEKQDFKQEETTKTQKHICEDAFCEDSQQCFTAMEDVENVLKCFPRFSELEKAVYGSVWVSIPLEQGEYYFGKTQIGEDKYLCYAVRGKKQECPEELKELSCFVPSTPYKPDEGFFIMFQDAEKGTVVKK